MTEASQNLRALLKAIAPVEIAGPQNSDISQLTADSRLAAPGTMFVAVRGVNVDGHRFIPAAVTAGAAAIVCEEFPDEMPQNVCFIRVADSADALGRLASQWYGNPSRKLTLLGVTGTNGKTTIATLLYEMARLSGCKAGLLSTVSNIVDTTVYEAVQTTPDPLSIHRLLHDMVEVGCTFAAMEVSSHAAQQRRIAGLHFKGGIFTNLTRDHLDYHKTFDAYLKAKKSFFDGLGADAFALVNLDDSHGTVMLQNTCARKADYSIQRDADFTARPLEDRLDGMLLEIDGTEVETMFTGRFNASNLLAVYGAWRLLGHDKDSTLLNMSRLRPVAGRFQTVTNTDRTITGVVDYAHTPDALINVLDTLREVCGCKRRIITVCGAGGNRDHGKRPLMAEAAARRSDRLILTSDNPRNEDPEAILADMRAGLDSDQAARTLSICDRREAIRTAVALAQPGDVILVAGKGHEDYQIIGDVKRHFSDLEELQAAFKV